MRKTLALSLGLLALAPSSAHANPGPHVHLLLPSPVVSLVGAGTTCGVLSIGEPDVNVQQIGALFGGPLVVVTPPLATVSMKCSVQVGAAGSTHDGADVAVATSITTIGVTVALNVPVMYPSSSGQPVFVCTEILVNGEDFFWDAPSGEWFTTGGVASCAEAFVQEL